MPHATWYLVPSLISDLKPVDRAICSCGCPRKTGWAHEHVLLGIINGLKPVDYVQLVRLLSKGMWRVSMCNFGWYVMLQAVVLGIINDLKPVDCV